MRLSGTRRTMSTPTVLKVSACARNAPPATPANRSLDSVGSSPLGPSASRTTVATASTRQISHVVTAAGRAPTQALMAGVSQRRRCRPRALARIRQYVLALITDRVVVLMRPTGLGLYVRLPIRRRSRNLHRDQRQRHRSTAWGHQAAYADGVLFLRVRRTRPCRRGSGHPDHAG